MIKLSQIPLFNTNLIRQPIGLPKIKTKTKMIQKKTRKRKESKTILKMFSILIVYYEKEEEKYISINLTLEQGMSFKYVSTT